MLKSLKYIFALLVAFLGILYACKRNNLEVTETHKQFKPENFAQIGKDHNAKLDAVYKALVNKLSSKGVGSKFTESMTREQALEIGEQTILDDINLQTSLPIAIRDSAINLVSRTFDGVPLMENDKIYTQALANELSVPAKSILDRLGTLIKGPDSALAVINNDISLLEAEAQTLNLTEYEQLIVYSATNVARYSCAYWVENADLWEQLTQANPLSRSFWGWLKSVAVGDVAGGAAGAAGAWATNVVVGPGTVAYGGAIAAGAAGGSVYNAIAYFF